MNGRRTKTASTQPGKMPDAGSHGPPRAPSTRNRRGLWHARRNGAMNQSGTPTRRKAKPAKTMGGT
eukprot:3998783-Lingulodinium_polyedra.AAC.1